MKKTILASAVLCALSTGAFAATYGSIEVNGATATENDLSNETNQSVVITGPNDARAITATAEADDVTVRGKDIVLTSTWSETLRAQGGANVNLGGEETQIIKIVSEGDAVNALALNTNGRATTVNMTADNIEIAATGAGIWAQNGTELVTSPSNHTMVNLDATKITINAGTTGIVAFSNSEINIKGDLIVNAPRAIETRGNSVININATGEYTTVLNGDIAFATPGSEQNSGNILNSTLNINLNGAGSSWTGNLVQEYPASFEENQDKFSEWTTVTNASVQLSNGAQWTPTPVSEEDGVQVVKSQAMNHLTLDGGVVNITGDNINVTVENMTGTGTVNLATDGTTAGNFNVTVADANTSLDVNLMDVNMEKELTADEINADQAAKLLGNVGGETVTTTTEVKEGMVNNAFGVDSEGNVKTASVNTLMQSSLELATAAPLALNRIMMNDVRKRLGDIRTSNGTHGAWARYDGGRLSGEGDLENDFNTIQVGFDTMPSDNAPRVGVAFSYTDSDSEYARGSADMKAYSLAAYGTWMSDDGMFFDLIGRMGTADTDMVVDGQHKGSMNNMALSLSGEFGWRFDVTDSIYVEPQVEATYTFINGDNLSLSTANYDVDDVHSLLGRIGFAAGLKCPNERGNVYVRASAVHEFLGDSEIAGVNGASRAVYEIDGKDTWVEYGIGANFNLTQSTYMWADVERTSGGTLDEDWRATVGVRYSW